MTRREFLRWGMGGAAAVALSACGPSSPARPAASATALAGPHGWDELVQAAQREGVVNVSYGPMAGATEALVDAFQRDYPNIKAQGTVHPTAQMVSQAVAERAAGKYLIDVALGWGAGGLAVFKPVGALQPLQSALLLPEVLDPARWYGNQLRWIDAEQPYTTVAFQGIVQHPVAYNTQLVDPNEFTSWWDLVNPKWRGKIVMVDLLRSFGYGLPPLRFAYSSPELGPTFLARLFGDMNITLSSDQRQMADWLAQGRVHLSLFVGLDTIATTADQGLPVGFVPAERFREGAVMSGSGGDVSLMDRAPHPNAAKLHINWLLSRAGQIAWQQAIKQNSLRIDIPKDGIRQYTVPKPRVAYYFPFDEKSAQVDAAVMDLLRKGAQS